MPRTVTFRPRRLGTGRLFIVDYAPVLLGSRTFSARGKNKNFFPKNLFQITVFFFLKQFFNFF